MDDTLCTTDLKLNSHLRILKILGNIKAFENSLPVNRTAICWFFFSSGITGWQTWPGQQMTCFWCAS